jgi:catechol 2,3-dioxygenase-like lactoylglutathione lyase family enzyme
MSVKRVGNVFFAVDDLDAAASFYADVLGLPVKFRDGDRWMAFDAGGTTLALAGPPEDAVAAPGAMVSLEVGDLDEWIAAAHARGLDAGPVQTGPHERSVLVRDPAGNVLTVYAKRG